MATNLGRSVNVLSGFQGVTAGGTASINLPVGQRYHRLILQCVAVNYLAATSGVAQTAVKVKSTSGTIGTGTVTPTIANGVVTAATAGGTFTGTWAVGDLITFNDPTGIGAVLYVATLSSSLPATFNLTGTGASGGIAGPIDPRLLITSMKLLVNGQVIRDITPTSIIGILNHWGYRPQYGSLPLIFTEPARNFLRDAEMNSWDLAGQNTFQLQFGIATGYTGIQVYGVMEFDKLRNARTCTAANQAYLGLNPATNAAWAIGSKVPFLSPVGQHQFSYPITTGRFDITTLNFTYPITKIYLASATPGTIYGLDILADGNLILQTTAKDLAELNSEYNFQTSSPNYAPQLNGNGYGAYTPAFPTTNAQGQTPTTTPNGVLGSFDGTASQPYAWDAVAVFDMDSRPWKALRVASSLIVRVYSNLAQNVTVVAETLPGAYLG